MSEMKLCEAVLGEFLPMTEIPRPSHHEERISKYLFDWAVSRGLHAERDIWTWCASPPRASGTTRSATR